MHSFGVGPPDNRPYERDDIRRRRQRAVEFVNSQLVVGDGSRDASSDVAQSLQRIGIVFPNLGGEYQAVAYAPSSIDEEDL